MRHRLVDEQEICRASLAGDGEWSAGRDFQLLFHSYTPLIVFHLAFFWFSLLCSKNSQKSHKSTDDGSHDSL